MLINMMEHYVDERLSELLKDYNCCKCEVCLEDMKAFSLNRLPPKYVSTVNGQVFTRIKQELENQLHGRHENLDEQKDKQNRNSQRDDFLHRSLL